jgi:hypothetical protein
MYYIMCFTLYNSLLFFENIYLIIIVSRRFCASPESRRKTKISHFIYTCTIFIHFFCITCTNIFNIHRHYTTQNRCYKTSHRRRVGVEIHRIIIIIYYNIIFYVYRYMSSRVYVLFVNGRMYA